MLTIHPWINFNGNAEEAFAFYQSLFGGEFVQLLRFSDLAHAGFTIPEKEKNKLMCIVLSVGSQTLLVAIDVPELLGRVNERENRSKILVRTDNKEEADQLFAGLAEGGEVEGPMGEGPYGSYMGTLRDKYGIEWILEYLAK